MRSVNCVTLTETSLHRPHRTDPDIENVARVLELEEELAVFFHSRVGRIFRRQAKRFEHHASSPRETVFYKSGDETRRRKFSADTARPFVHCK